mgnify:FL=1
MRSTLHVLPNSLLELRPLRFDQPGREDAIYLLTSRDERARPNWELALSKAELRTLLEALADGEMSADVGQVRLNVYADPQLERNIAAWAIRELSRLGGDEAFLARVLGTQRPGHSAPSAAAF